MKRNQDPSPNSPKDTVEAHILAMPSPELPSTWREEILRAARHTTPSIFEVNRAQTAVNRQPNRIFSRLRKGLRNQFLPWAAAAMWLFMLSGRSIDAWLNESDTEPYYMLAAHSLQDAYEQRITSWRMAGLDLESGDRTLNSQASPSLPPAAERPRSHLLHRREGRSSFRLA